MIIRKEITFLFAAMAFFSAITNITNAENTHAKAKPQASVNKIADTKIAKLIDKFDDYPIYESELKTDITHGHIGMEKPGEKVKLDILFERREMSDLITISGNGIENKDRE